MWSKLWISIWHNRTNFIPCTHFLYHLLDTLAGYAGGWFLPQPSLLLELSINLSPYYLTLVSGTSTHHPMVRIRHYCCQLMSSLDCFKAILIKFHYPLTLTFIPSFSRFGSCVLVFISRFPLSASSSCRWYT